MAVHRDRHPRRHNRDYENWLKAQELKHKHVEQELRDRNAKREALNLLLVDSTDTLLGLGFKDFTFQVWIRSKDVPEINDDADKLPQNTNATAEDFTKFVYTGIRQAYDRYQARLLKERDNANRKQIQDIKTKTEQTGFQPALVAAAKNALAGTPNDRTDFLLTGQYKALRPKPRKPADIKGDGVEDLTVAYNYPGANTTLFSWPGTPNVVGGQPDPALEQRTRQLQRRRGQVRGRGLQRRRPR